MNNEELKQHARNIRKIIVKEIANAQSGHPGGSLGAADIVTYLYFEEMDITPENAGTIDRDRFVLSREGHHPDGRADDFPEAGFEAPGTSEHELCEGC